MKMQQQPQKAVPIPPPAVSKGLTPEEQDKLKHKNDYADIRRVIEGKTVAERPTKEDIIKKIFLEYVRENKTKYTQDVRKSVWDAACKEIFVYNTVTDGQYFRIMTDQTFDDVVLPTLKEIAKKNNGRLPDIMETVDGLIAGKRRNHNPRKRGKAEKSSSSESSGKAMQKAHSKNKKIDMAVSSADCTYSITITRDRDKKQMGSAVPLHICDPGYSEAYWTNLLRDQVELFEAADRNEVPAEEQEVTSKVAFPAVGCCVCCGNKLDPANPVYILLTCGENACEDCMNEAYLRRNNIYNWYIHSYCEISSEKRGQEDVKVQTAPNWHPFIKLDKDEYDLSTKASSYKFK